MEKRLIIFMVVSITIIFAHISLQRMLAPPPPPQVADADGPQPDGDQADARPEPQPDEPATDETESAGTPEPAVEPIDLPLLAQELAQQWVTLGSADPGPGNPYRMLVTLTTQGSAIERIELSSPRYRDLGSVGNQRIFGRKSSGYLGHLALTDHPAGRGCVVNVVGAGTPAAAAQPQSVTTKQGLRSGDVITGIDDEQTPDAEALLECLNATRPGQNVRLSVRRKVQEVEASLDFSVTLGNRPLEIIRPGSKRESEDTPPHPLSFLMTLDRIGSASVATGEDEIVGLPSMHNRNWQITKRPSGNALGADEEQVVEFTMTLGSDQLKAVGQTGALQVVRRYRLSKGGDPQKKDSPQAYHLDMEIELRNLGGEVIPIAYRLDGPTGLPLEGFWYTYKVHPKMFHAAGARDVVWRSADGDYTMFGCSEIAKKAKKEPRSPATSIFSDPQELRFAGVDTQYFAAILMPDHHAPPQTRPLRLSAATAQPVGEIDEKLIKRTDVSFQLITRPHTIEPHQTLTQRYRIFAGPKDPVLLAQYELDDLIIYGWFFFVAKPMIQLLHFFYWVTSLGGNLSIGNYGIAVIMLTVLVRGCMFPLGRRQAQMAAKMQELAPEMKRIAEHHKGDMEKRTKAQQELFRKHNYNPLSGCLPMVIQLPIFIGLYRALSVDIELRGTPLIPGISWCSNLAAPDQLFYWEPFLPAFLVSLTGWLGPYFNILPLITIAFFIIHQKLFTPPATDEQSAMQQKMMKFMMIFMGFLFFRVASGLCLYIIASSAWGVAERLLLPKSKPVDGSAPVPSANLPSSREPRSSSNGSSKKSTGRKRNAKGKKR